MQISAHPYSGAYHYSSQKKSLISRFLNWSVSQEKYRFGWLAFIIASHGCLITPVTLFFVMTTGNNLVLWAFVIVSMGMALVTNLAALPTKITIPVFFLSLLINIIVVLNCFV